MKLFSFYSFALGTILELELFCGVSSHRDFGRNDVLSFGALSCNSNVDSVNCTPFKELIPTDDSELLIGCGECAEIDENLDAELPGGLLIVGKLWIRAGNEVTIRSPHVFVEGIFRIDPPDSIVPSGSNGQECQNCGVDIILTGEDDQFFSYANRPHETSFAQENFGSKAFAVVGGELDIRGMPEECPTWSKLMDVRRNDEGINEIRVSQNTFGCWGENAEILITPHFHCYKCYQVRKVGAIDSEGWIALDTVILQTTSEADDPRLAVEVALLSRNVRFRGEKPLADGIKDGTLKAGGHSIIFRTPSPQIQSVQGVEFRNFGQAGNAGRYPLHFHVSRDVEGSSWKKNIVRDSYQRCYVVHGTHKLLLEDNIAFTTHGHCFLLEDSVEMDNTFKRNLVASTEFPLAPLSIGGRPDESDKDPSSYWVTNPKNNFIENVSAGCRHNGWWFELTPKVRGISAFLPEAENLNPVYLPLGIYSGNIVHSNHGFAVKTYRGAKYKGPGENRQTMSSWKIYRNRFSGLFWTFNNIDLVDCFLADNINQPSVNFGRSVNSRLIDTTIIGDTDLMMEQYRNFPSPQNKYACGSHGRVGLWVQGAGRSFVNVTFSNFKSHEACEVAAIGIEYNSGAEWSLEQSFRETKFNNVESAFMDFCKLRSGQKTWDSWKHSEVGIHDEDGSITSENSGAYVTVFPFYWSTFDDAPSGSQLCETSKGIIICNTGTLPIWSQECYEADQVAPCAAICPVPCYEEVEVWVSMESPENMKMRVTDVTSGIFVDYNELIPKSHGINYRIFSPKLPVTLKYEFKFLDEEEPIWPHSIKGIYKKGSCGSNFAEIEVFEPNTSCHELLINGNAETGNMDGWDKSSTTSISTEGANGSSYSFKLARNFIQSLDARCTRGQLKLNFRADMKVLGTDSNCSNKGIGVRVNSNEQKKSDWYVGEWFVFEHTFEITFGPGGGGSIRISTPFPWCSGLELLLDNVSLRLDNPTISPSNPPIKQPVASPTKQPVASPTKQPVASPRSFKIHRGFKCNKKKNQKTRTAKNKSFRQCKNKCKKIKSCYGFYHFLQKKVKIICKLFLGKMPELKQVKNSKHVCGLLKN